MATTEERLQILKMIQSGKITAEEGEKLIEALRARGRRPDEEEAPLQSRWLRIRVTDAGTGKGRFSVNLPMSLVDLGLRTAMRFAPELEEEYGLDELRTTLRSGVQGKVLDAEDEEGNQHIEIFVE